MPEVAVTHDDGHFDEHVASRYDADDALPDAQSLCASVEFLAGAASGGRVLEFGIGTGRVALALAAHGLEVEGIDLSRAMVRRLRAKPGGGQIPVEIGDFATVRLGRTFSLVYLVFNTINNLTTQAAQVACFENAAAHLEPGGRFVVEVGVPALQRLPPGETTVVFRCDDQQIGIDAYDVVTQRFTSHHIGLADGQTARTSIPFRYVWPAELDLMARIAGLSRAERWGGWCHEAFTAQSTSHISVWRKEG